MKKRAYYHLRGYLSFMNCTQYFCRCSGNIENISMTGVRLVQYTGLRQDCILGQAVTSFGEADAEKVLDLMQEYQISDRLTFSNSLLREEHLQDRKCNELCALLEKNNKPSNGVIIHSDLLSYYLQRTIRVFIWSHQLQSTDKFQ